MAVPQQYTAAAPRRIGREAEHESGFPDTGLAGDQQGPTPPTARVGERAIEAGGVRFASQQGRLGRGWEDAVVEHSSLGPPTSGARTGIGRRPADLLTQQLPVKPLGFLVGHHVELTLQRPGADPVLPECRCAPSLPGVEPHELSSEDRRLLRHGC